MSEPMIDLVAVRRALRAAAKSPDSWWVDPACLESVQEAVDLRDVEDIDEYDLLDAADRAQLAAIMRL